MDEISGMDRVAYNCRYRLKLISIYAFGTNLLVRVFWVYPIQLIRLFGVCKPEYLLGVLLPFMRGSPTRAVEWEQQSERRTLIAVGYQRVSVLE